MVTPSNEHLRDLNILVVDDEPRNIDVLQRLLARAGYNRVQSTTKPADALTRLGEEMPDLVLLDLRMPVVDGFAIMDCVRSLVPEGAYLPILVLTGDVDPQTRERALSAGATDFLTKPFEANEALLRIRNLLHTRYMHERLRRHNEGLEEMVQERTQELEMAQREILARLALAAEYRDDITGKHAQRVGGVSGLVALELGMDASKAALLQQAAPLHDVGKIGIPDTILLKPGRLTQDEIAIIRTHTTIGARILDGSRFDLLHLAREIALSHHEWWDGSGYEGWVGTDIPLSGRIVAVADVFDSLSHERPYKPAIALPQVVEIMLAESETHFDPDVFQAFLNLLERGDLEEIRSMGS